MTLLDNSISETQWWVNNIEQACRCTTTMEPDLTIYNDVSLTGWGVTDKVHPSGEFWHNEEMTHINVIKLQAIFYGIKIYYKNHVLKHVKVMLGKTAAIFYINPMGSPSLKIVIHWHRKSGNRA